MNHYFSFFVFISIILTLQSQNEQRSEINKVFQNENNSHNLFEVLLQRYVSKDGKVNYKGFKASKEKLQTYISKLQNQYPKVNSFTKNEQIAYWINAYNALTIDLILRYYPIKSIKDIDSPWNQRLWIFGKQTLSLNTIEHDILRPLNEPRIHFAIVCASISCPKLKNSRYTAKNLDEQLTQATKTFLADDTKNNIAEHHIKLSKIFKWFAKDFKSKGTLISFLNQYSTIKISENAKKSFKSYNWALNE